MSFNLATYGVGDSFDRSASKGFIDLHSLPSKTWSGVQGPAARLNSEACEEDGSAFMVADSLSA